MRHWPHIPTAALRMAAIGNNHVVSTQVRRGIHRRAWRGAVAGLALSIGLTVPATGQEAEPVAIQAVTALTRIFGSHPGARVVHAKGIVCEGYFTPATTAASVTRAPHLQGAVVPVVARFSDFAGIPTVASGSDLASPRGLAIKFVLPDGSDTDIVTHSYDGFPARTPEDFLGFLTAIGDSAPGGPAPHALEAFAAAHPAAGRFLATAKPIPASYAAESFFGVNALRFTNAAGNAVFGRYRIVPTDDMPYLTAADAASRAPDFLAAELTARLQHGPATFRIMLQLAATGDDVKDASVAWPADRDQVELGRLTLQRIAADNRETERKLLFTPLNLTDGIGSSGDPLLAARTRAYAKSFSLRETH